MKSKDGRFEIQKERTDSHDHFMKADYEWRVVDLRSGRCVARFDEAYDGDATGVKEITFSSDGLRFVVLFHDGSVETRDLPS